MRFSPPSVFHPTSSERRRAERETTGSDQPVGEDAGTVWQQSAAPATAPGPASDGPLSWPPGHTRWPTPMRRPVSTMERKESEHLAVARVASCNRAQRHLELGCLLWSSGIRGTKGRESRVVTRALVRAGSGCVSRLEEGEEELTFGPACKREGGSKWGGQLGCWPGPCRGSECRAVPLDKQTSAS